MNFEEWWDEYGAKFSGSISDAKKVWLMSREPWPDDRRVEYKKLQRLLGIMANLNNSNKCLDRLQEAVKIANDLLEFDCVEPRVSFIGWLHAQSAGFGRGHGD